MLWSAARVDHKENRILRFLNIHNKIAFYPNQKIFSQMFIAWNVGSGWENKNFDDMGTLNKYHNFYDYLIIGKYVQSNLDYPDLDYPDYSIIRTFFSGPNFFMNIN